MGSLALEHLHSHSVSSLIPVRLISGCHQRNANGQTLPAVSFNIFFNLWKHTNGRVIH